MNVIMDYKKYISEKIKVDGVSSDEIAVAISLPPNTEMGDYALPCFKFAKVLRKSPVAIAEELASQIESDDVIAGVSAVNGYLNFKLNRRALAKATLSAVKENENYGSSKMGNGKTVCIDYSSVNIATLSYRSPFNDRFWAARCTKSTNFSATKWLA